MNKYLLSLLLLAPFVYPATAQFASGDTVTVGVEAAITRAVEVSPDIGEVRAGRDFAAARSRFARANRVLSRFEAETAHAIAPALDIPADNTFPDDALYLNPDVENDWENPRPFNQVEIDFGQPIYTWGELSGNIEAARHGVEVEEAAVRRKESEVALRAGMLYYKVLLTDALMRLTDEAGTIVRQAKREVARLLEEGAEGVDDADQFKVQLTEQEYNRRVVEVTQQRTTARSALQRQLFLPEGTAVEPEAQVLEPLAFIPEPLAQYEALALAHRPELDQAAAGLAAREALVKVARSDFYPKLLLGGRARFAYAAGRHKQDNAFINEDFLSNSVRAGFSLQQELNFFQTRARVEQAEAEREEVRFQQAGARQLILLEVEQAYRNLLIAQAALEAQDASLQITREWLRTEQINFDLDLGDTENLIDAVQAQLTQEASYYDAVQRYNTAVLKLLHATGTLVGRAQSGTLVE